MGYDRDKEAKPVSNIYVDVPVPSVNQIVTLSSGVPSGGTDIGALAKGIKWQPEYELLADEVENFDAPVGYDKVMTGLRMVVPAKEISGYNLQLASGGKKIVMGDGTYSIRIGTGNEIETHSFLCVWERKAGSGVYEQAMIYEGYVENAVEVNFDRSEFTVLEMTIVGRIVSGRNAQDNMGYCTAFE